MILKIEHRTSYVYEELVFAARQYLRLTPSNDAFQTVHDWHVDALGHVSPWSDSLGNICHHREINRPDDNLTVVAAGIIETRDPAGRGGQDDALPLAVYRRETAYTAPGPAFTGFLGDLASARPDDDLDLPYFLMDRIRDAISYRISATDVGTDAEQALARGEGVCQDHSHAMIAASRHFGLPARYVSGYLYTGENGTAAEASHAWAEVHLGAGGWIGFDVANRCLADERYVRLARGFDYASAAPIYGMRRGGGTETLSVEVEIVRLETLPRGFRSGTRGRQSGMPAQVDQ